MDNILEILIPLIFAAIYFFGNMFSGKSDGDSAPSIPGGRQEEYPDVIERQRKIQEEIRRKIAERRGGEDSRSPLDAPSYSPAPSQTQPPLATYESQIQERLKRIEATNRRAEKLKEQVISPRTAALLRITHRGWGVAAHEQTSAIPPLRAPHSFTARFWANPSAKGVTKPYLVL